LLYAIISVILRISVYFEMSLDVPMLEVFKRERKIVILVFYKGSPNFNFNLKEIKAKPKYSSGVYCKTLL